jgi:two-component system nitrogen regulation sensor histidine kinase GlnL
VPAPPSAKQPHTLRPADRLGWTDVLASISDGVVVFDEQGVVGDLNPAAELLTDTPASQAIGADTIQAFARPTHRWIVDLVGATLRQSVTHRRTEETLHRAGQDVVVSAACAPILDASGTPRGAVLVLHDHTLQHTIESANRHAERLTGLASVAAGLAHEIRNPLGGIKGAAQLLRSELTDPGQVRCTDLIIREVERLAGLVDQLRDLGSPPPLTTRPINIHRVLNEVVELERQAPEWGSIELVAEFDPSLPPVLGDRPQLVQVFLNLVKNAAEALERTGTITLETRMDTSYRVRRGGGPAHFLAVTVFDTGPGVPEADRPHLFAPFFTTKHRGTGLGLALCQRIVTQHGGAIVYDPPSRGGARFRVTLPVSDTHHDPGN